jgi:hypothetical protein
VFENMGLRRIFGSKSEEVAGGWRRLYSEEFHNSYNLPNIGRVTKSRRTELVGHATCTGDEK